MSQLEAEMQSGFGPVNTHVDCTQLAEVSSCATGVSDVSSKSLHDCPQGDLEYEEEQWDAPIGDDELSTSFMHTNVTEAVRYRAQDGGSAGEIDPVGIGPDPLHPPIDDILLRDIGITDKEILAPSEMLKSRAPERKVAEFPLALLDGFLPSII